MPRLAADAMTADGLAMRLRYFRLCVDAVEVLLPRRAMHADFIALVVYCFRCQPAAVDSLLTCIGMPRKPAHD